MSKRKLRTVPKLVIWTIVLFIVFLFFYGIKNTFFKKDAYPLKYSDEVSLASIQTGIDEATLYAVIYCESSFNPNAISVSNAVGLMQILPSTYIEVSNDTCDETQAIQKLYDPKTNILSGAEYLKYLQNTLQDFLTDKDMVFSWELVHAAYHAGIGNVITWIENGQIGFDENSEIKSLPIKSTEKYVEKIRKVKAEYIKILEKTEE